MKTKILILTVVLWIALCARGEEVCAEMVLEDLHCPVITRAWVYEAPVWQDGRWWGFHFGTNSHDTVACPILLPGSLWFRVNAGMSWGVRPPFALSFNNVNQQGIGQPGWSFATVTAPGWTFEFTTVQLNTYSIEFDLGFPGHNSAVVLAPGDELSLMKEVLDFTDGIRTTRDIVRINDTIIHSSVNGQVFSQNMPLVDLTSGWEFTGQVWSHYAPLPDSLIDLNVLLGDPANRLYDGASATWGYTTTNTIPSMGSVTSSLVSGPDLIGESAVFSSLGYSHYNYTFRDNHSLSTVEPYLSDVTFAEASRWIAVRTSAAPILRTTYNASARDKSGDLLSPLTPTYTPLGNTVTGGEDGWTNQPLDIIVEHNNEPGTYDVVLKLPGETAVAVPTPAYATRNAYQVDSPIVEGETEIIGVLTATGNPSVELSPEVRGKVKIDTVNPVVAFQHHGGWNFTDSSTDALSGISPPVGGLAPTRMAFVPTGGPLPADAEYEELNSITPQALGNYDIYMWVTDRAGNEVKGMIQSDYFVGGEVIITKDSNRGATLHREACPDANAFVALASCLGCSTGLGVEITENTNLTYTIKLENADPTNSAHGTFEDYLPLGMLPASPSATIAGNPLSLLVSLETMGPYAGQWKISGSYTGLIAGFGNEIEITIPTAAPTFDASIGATNIISNQASTNWNMISGGLPISGTNVSAHVVHRVNQPASVSKRANWGAAVHGATSSTHDSLTDGGATPGFVAGATGYVQVGDVISYELTFANPSNQLRYFASNTSGIYDALPTGVSIAGQRWSVERVDAVGNVIPVYAGNIPLTGINALPPSGTPSLSGTLLDGLAVNASANALIQTAGTISLGAGEQLIVTIQAMVNGDVGDILTSQLITGYADAFENPAGNAATLRTLDSGVRGVQSNYVTHQIEQGTTLRKWAYSNTSDANNPTLHSVGCPESGNLFVPGTCLGCTLGGAKLQKDTVITYSLTMDNTKNLHRGSDLAGNIASGTPIPGGYIDNKHANVVIPEGLTVDPSTLRVYITDRNGDSVPISNGSGIFSTPVIVNENGTSVTREVLNISGTNVDIKDTGEGSTIFTLSNISLADNGTRWELNLDNRAYASGMINDYTGYSITYLFDATVIGEHDSVVSVNNAWVNHWKQDNGNRVHNPENPVVSAVVPASILSNSVVHARLSDAVDTLFTKVGADDIITGLAGAEFVLYKWEGSDPPTTAQANHIVDTAVVNDTSTMPAGQWVRVKANAALATLSDIFTSSNIPSERGEVDLGKLPTGTYTLIETKAPSGYALPVGQWLLTIDSDNTDTGASDWKIEIIGKSNSIAPPAAIRDETIPNAPTYKLVNAEPFLIGLSGLGGTTGMLLAGFVIMAIAGNIYLVRRHKQKGK